MASQSTAPTLSGVLPACHEFMQPAGPKLVAQCAMLPGGRPSGSQADPPPSSAFASDEALTRLMEQLYSLSLCSREDCVKILAKYQWNLQIASRYLIRLTASDRAGPPERDRPLISPERRV